MELILICLITGVIVSIAVWKYFSTKGPTIVEPIAPYKIEEPVVIILEPVVETMITDTVAVKPAKIRVKKQKAPTIVVEAVIEPSKGKRTKSKKI